MGKMRLLRRQGHFQNQLSRFVAEMERAEAESIMKNQMAHPHLTKAQMAPAAAQFMDEVELEALPKEAMQDPAPQVHQVWS